MTDQSKPHLWMKIDEVFHADVGRFSLGDGYGETCGSPDQETWAHVIRALADWWVPDEDPGEFTTALATFDAIARNERQNLRQMLLDEADYAEAGE